MNMEMERAGNFISRVDERAARPSEVDRRVVALTAPASMAAEQYRTLYFRLERLREQRPMKIIAVTSAVRGEGKTVTALNLALTASRANPDRQILLIDADMRCGRVGEMLGLRTKPGLTEVLAGECEVHEAVRRFQSTRLAIIPSGSSPEESTQLLASPRMKKLLVQTRDAFDEVYVDLPPTLPFADAAILSAQSDGVVLVIRANVTPFKQIQTAIEYLAGAPVVGCVLNGAEPAAAPYLKSYKK